MDEFKECSSLLVVVLIGRGYAVRRRARVPNSQQFDLAAIDRLHEPNRSARNEPETEKPAVANDDMVSPFTAETVTSATRNGDMRVTPTRPYP